MLNKKNKKILVVEDDESIRFALKMLLEDEGYQIDTADHGGEAINYLHSNEPHLIILDLMMPVVDGYKFRQEQKMLGLCLQVPVIVMSADSNIEKKLNKLDGQAYIKKPFNIEELLTSVRVMLD